MSIGDTLRARSASAHWMGHPTGLGHFDVSLYLRLGRELEARSARFKDKPAFVLDLGTYFGHSAFTIVQGAALVSAQPKIRVLSLDIFEQPEWLLSQTDVAAFLRTYHSTDRESVGRSLKDHCGEASLPADSITLWKKDVNELTVAELLDFAPAGFDAVAIDCGKTPELMNRIVLLVCDPAVTHIGTYLCFQDLFDWHSPWNLVAYWKLLKLGFIRIHSVECGLAPLAEMVNHGDPGLISDRIEHRDPGWASTYMDGSAELEAFDGMAGIFDQLHCTDLALRVRCLRVGALLRQGQLTEAESAIEDLDVRWPCWLKDGPLQEAYRRYRHLKTGKKDLQLRLESRSAVARKSTYSKVRQRAHVYSQYLRSPGSALALPLPGFAQGSRVAS